MCLLLVGKWSCPDWSFGWICLSTWEIKIICNFNCKPTRITNYWKDLLDCSQIDRLIGHYSSRTPTPASSSGAVLPAGHKYWCVDVLCENMAKIFRVTLHNLRYDKIGNTADQRLVGITGVLWWWDEPSGEADGVSYGLLVNHQGTSNILKKHFSTLIKTTWGTKNTRIGSLNLVLIRELRRYIL